PALSLPPASSFPYTTLCRSAILFTMLIGDELGVIEARYQPMKIAAAEAQWTTCQPCSFSLFQIGGGNNDHTPTQILAIPHLLSLDRKSTRLNSSHEWISYAV